MLTKTKEHFLQLFKILIYSCFGYFFLTGMKGSFFYTGDFMQFWIDERFYSLGLFCGHIEKTRQGRSR